MLCDKQPPPISVSHSNKTPHKDHRLAMPLMSCFETQGDIPAPLWDCRSHSREEKYKRICSHARYMEVRPLTFQPLLPPRRGARNCTPAQGAGQGWGSVTVLQKREWVMVSNQTTHPNLLIKYYGSVFQVCLMVRTSGGKVKYSDWVGLQSQRRVLKRCL